MPVQDTTILVDGSMDYSGGIDSYKVTTVQSQRNPNGLARNELAWLANGTTRGGVIEPRTGWEALGGLRQNPGLFQGWFMYQPLGAFPYPILLMDGILYAIFDVDHPSLTDLTGGNPALLMPPTQPQAFFCQGEQFLVIQAGDGVTLPLFWDGTTLRRSFGLAPPPGQTRELPAAYMMTYYQQRIWYAYGDLHTYTAGDIVADTASGTPAYRYRDSILKVTENPLAIGGDGFSIPTNAGNIRWLGYAATNNTLLGQGVLLIGTRRQIYGLQVPIDRTAWKGADTNNMPLQYVVALSTGPVNDRSVVQVNSDVFFQTLQPSIQSLGMAVRNDQAWGDTPISINENRILAFNERSLLYAASGIYFDNRLLETAIPVQTPNGVVHQALLPLNFDEISTIDRKLSPVWEGMYAGLDFLQLATGDFGGRDRAFGIIISRNDGSLQLWELTAASKRDTHDNRITEVIEFPAYTWNMEIDLKELLAGELWLDDIRGEVEFILEYRPDSDPCWYDWHRWKVCWARDSNETLDPMTPYPTAYGPGYESTLTLPHPPQKCNSATGRPAYIAYQIQCRLWVTGWCRVRGFWLHATLRQRELYARNVCGGNIFRQPSINQPTQFPSLPTPGGTPWTDLIEGSESGPIT